MKRSKFTESQIVFALQQAETGVAVAEVVGTWRERSHFLRLGEEVRRPGSGRVETVAAVGRREPAAETDRGGPDAGQADAPGVLKKSSEVSAAPRAG